MAEAQREQLYGEWRRLINVTASELRRFLDQYGNVAGLSRPEAKAEGVRSGRDSARALLRMLPKGTSYARAAREWTEADWQWAKRQVAFVKRMRGAPGPLLNDRGEPTRKHLALLLWGHDPQRKMRRNPGAPPVEREDLAAVVLATIEQLRPPARASAEYLRTAVADHVQAPSLWGLSPAEQSAEVRAALRSLTALGLVRRRPGGAQGTFYEAVRS